MKKDQKKLTARSENEPKWYQELMLRADLADYSPVRGCMVIKPYGYRIWELLKENLDKKIKNMDVKNAYFPLFIPYTFLEKEADHVEGFAPEVATVTHAGGKKLEEKLAVRPTSETIIYSMFAQWIESYRDLPYKINQWANIVRWEKRTLPFIRTSEFLWQEGHTLHANKDKATEQVIEALEVYEKTLKEVFSLYGIPGKKTEAEKFAGGEYTYTIETMMKNGKALQTCTSHLLSHSFVKSFDVEFLDENGKHQTPWATSWGLSTRSIGGLILAHGDDLGLVLPPNAAPTQIIIIPISKGEDTKFKKVIKEKIMKQLSNYRVEIDWSDNTPGWKFAQSEMRGIPIRLEIGPRELENQEISYFIRYNSEKGKIKFNELNSWIKDKLKEIGKGIYENHKKFTEDNIIEVDNYEDFKKAIKQEKGFVKGYFNPENKEAEAEIKADTHASTRCMPLKNVEQKGDSFYNDEKGNVTLFSKAY